LGPVYHSTAADPECKLSGARTAGLPPRYKPMLYRKFWPAGKIKFTSRVCVCCSGRCLQTGSQYRARGHRQKVFEVHLTDRQFLVVETVKETYTHLAAVSQRWRSNGDDTCQIVCVEGDREDQSPCVCHLGLPDGSPCTSDADYRQTNIFIYICLGSNEGFYKMQMS